MFVYGGNWSSFCFDGVCGPKVNNGGKCLTLFVTVLFMEENGYQCLSRKSCSEILFKIKFY